MGRARSRPPACTACGKPEVAARGLCWAHYKAQWRQERRARLPACTSGRSHRWGIHGKCLDCQTPRPPKF